MSIHFDEQQWQRIREDYRKWWVGELDRPLIAATITGYEPDRQPPPLPARGFTAFYPAEVTAEAIVDRWDYDLSRCRFLGDAFPTVWPNFGAGVVAAFTGCRAENSESTVWFHAEKELELRDVHIRYNGRSPAFKRIADIVKAAGKQWKGIVQVGMTDLGGNLDVLASFRTTEKLLTDLYDCPQEVKRVRDEIHDVWWKYYRALDKAMRPPNPGYTAWTAIFSEEPYYMLQCDFAYMLSPAMFDEFVKPELAASCRKLKNAFYHLDGIGQLPHLDSLLSIPELKGIQWIPGDGQPDETRWPEVYRKIQRAGKLIQVFSRHYAGGFQIVDVLKEQLGSAKGIIVIGSCDRKREDDIRCLIEKHQKD